MRNAAARWAAMPALLFLITVGFFWKLVLTGQFTWLDHPDMVNQVLPWYKFQAGEWHAGRFPLWDPNLWGGQPLVGQVQPGAAYPLNWVLFLMPLHNGHISRLAMHWYFVIIHYMGALFLYCLCRDLKRSRAASLFAGAAFGFGGYIGTTEWPQLLNGAVWAPLVFLFFLRAMRGEHTVRNAALSGAFLGISFLGGHHQIPVLTSVAVAGAWLYYAFRGGRPARRFVAAGAVFALEVFLAGALQILPAREYGKLALRWVGSQNPVFWDQFVPYSVHAQYSLFPLSVLGIVFPGIHRHEGPFIGLAVISFAIIAACSAWREPAVRFFSVLLLGALLFALGGYSVFHGVLYSVVPMVEKARYPAMAILLFHLGVTVLAAFGFDAWRERANETAWRKPLIRGLLAVSALTYAVLLALSRFRPQQQAEYEQVAVTALTALLLAGLFHAWNGERIPVRAALAFAFVLVLFELGTVTGYNYLHRETPGGTLYKLTENSDIVQYLRSVPEPVRLEVHEEQTPINFGDWHGVEQFRAYTALGANIAYIEAEPRTLMLFGLNYYLGREPKRPTQVEVYRGRSGLNLYRNPEAFPRVWTVHEARRIRSKPEILEALRDPAFNPRSATFISGAVPELAVCGGDRVRLVNREPNRVVIDAEMGCKGMVILGDAFFPGWEATVDGQPAHIHDAYTVLRGVAVNGGRHRIEMRYRPMPVYAGGALTAVGLMSVLLIAASIRLGWREKAPADRNVFTATAG